MESNFAPYSLHPSFAHWSAMLVSLEDRTKKNLDQWLAALQAANVNTPAECRAYLKSQDLNAATIGLIIDHMAGKSPDTYDPKNMVAELFKGPKSALLPLYETILHFVLKLGPDVKACPCQTMVPFYRNHVVAQVKPSTKTRLDLGLALGDLAASKPATLIDTGGFAKKDRVTHRIELTATSDFNDFTKDWLRRAYDSDSR